MSTIFYEKLLRSFSKANTLRKQKLATDAGYSTIAEYKAFLTGNAYPVNTATVPTTKPIIHVVDVIDCSGSMSGKKIEAAVKGINAGIESLKTETSVNNLYSLIWFESNNVVFDHLRKDPKSISSVTFRALGGTPLYDAIGKVINEFKGSTDKVLINIYTDGGENSSRTFTKNQIKNLIAEVKDYITVTFIGTNEDTVFAIREFGVDVSNTLVYDGTAAGLDKSINATVSARTIYSMNVAAGNDVRTGFYKEVVKK